MDILKARKKAKEIKKKKQEGEISAVKAKEEPVKGGSQDVLPASPCDEKAGKRHKEKSIAEDSSLSLMSSIEEEEFRKSVLKELEEENKLITKRADEFAFKTRESSDSRESKKGKKVLPVQEIPKPDPAVKLQEKAEDPETEDNFDEVTDDDPEDKDKQKAEKTEETIKFLVFRIGKEFYSIDIMKIKKIDPIDEITRVPNTPEYVSGVISLRGEIIPVFNLKKKMRIGEYKGIKKPTIIILKEQNAGIIIDFVVGVQEIKISDIDKAANIVGSIDSEFITGIVRNRGLVFSVLDITGLIRKEILEDINNYFSVMRF